MIKTISFIKNEISNKCKKHGLQSSCNVYSTKSGYKVLLKESVTFFWQNIFESNCFKPPCDKFNALTRSASPNVSQKLFRSSTK